MGVKLRQFPDENTKIGGIIILHRQTKKVLLLQKHNGKWDLPKGHVERGESFLDGAVRECYEETGLDVGDGSLDVFPYTYISLPSKKWLRFYLGFTREDDIVTQEEEHAGYRWATIDKAVDLFGDNNQFSQIVLAMGVLSKAIML